MPECSPLRWLMILKLATNRKIDCNKIAKIWLVKFWMVNFKIVYLAQFSMDLNNLVSKSKSGYASFKTDKSKKRAWEVNFCRTFTSSISLFLELAGSKVVQIIECACTVFIYNFRKTHWYRYQFVREVMTDMWSIKEMIQYVTLGIPKEMKNFLIRNENITSEECRTENRLK